MRNLWAFLVLYIRKNQQDSKTNDHTYSIGTYSCLLDLSRPMIPELILCKNTTRLKRWKRVDVVDQVMVFVLDGACFKYYYYAVYVIIM